MSFDFVYTDETVPDNMLFQVVTGDSNFDRPIIACPIINRKHFQEFCAAKNCYPEDMPVETEKFLFPIIQRYYNIYKLYEEYINENPPKWWYIENLGKDICEHYFTTIRFLEPQTKKAKERRRRSYRRYIAERIVYKRRLEKEAKAKQEAKKNSEKA